MGLPQYLHSQNKYSHVISIEQVRKLATFVGLPQHSHLQFKYIYGLVRNTKGDKGQLDQSCQFCPLVPQASFLDLGGFLNFTEIIGCPHEAAAINLRQQLGLNEAATIRLPQLLLNNDATTMRLPQLA